MAAHSSRGRFIGHDPETLVPVIGNVVESGDHASGIIGCDDAERRVRPSVEGNPALDSGNLPVLLHSDLEPHVLLVSSPPVHEHFLAAVNHLHRSSYLLGGNGCDQIQGSRSGFSSKPTPHRRTDDPDLPERNIQHSGHHVVDIMRNLCGGIEHEC
ncbi:hypothetical protein ES703_34124 [subsurface metagenome]